MTAQEKISSTVRGAKLLWLFAMVVTALIVWVQAPHPAYLLFLFPIALVTYLGSIALAMIYLTHTIDPAEFAESPSDSEIHVDKLNELNRRLDEGTLKPGPELTKLMQESGILEITPVTQTSDEIVGTYNGTIMYEWVELNDPVTKRVERFFYEGPVYDHRSAMKHDGRTRVVIDEIIYGRD